MALMMAGYLANPRAFANRVFALFMLSLVVSAGGVLLLITAPSYTVAAAGIWLHAAAVICTVPLVAMLLLSIFAPTFRYRRQLTWCVGAFGVVALVLLAADIFVPGNLVYRFEPQSYVSGYISLADYLQGTFGPLLYLLSVQAPHLLFPLFILWALLMGLMPAHQWKVAWPILLILVVVIAINTIVLWRMPALLGLAGSLSVAVIATWSIVRYKVLSPSQIGQKQALDTAVFGILVFDEWGGLLSWNKTACRMLFLMGEPSGYRLFDLLNQWSETAVNQDGVHAFIQETAVPFAEDRSLGLILPDPANPPGHSWLLLQFTAILSNNKPVGVLCTVEDQTAVRESQNQLQAANQSLEQFAYRMTLLNDITQTGISDLDMKTMLQRFADRLGDLFLADGCYITLWDDTQKIVHPGAAYGPMRQIYPDIPLLPGKPTVTETILESGRYLVIEDLTDSAYSHFNQVAAFTGRSMLTVPLIAGSQKLGAVLIVFNEAHAFDTGEIHLGEQAANQIALAIAKMKLLQSEREQRELAEILHEISTALTATLDYDVVLNMTLAQIQHIVPYDTANLTLLERGEIHISRTIGYESFTSALPDQLAERPFSLSTVATFRQMVESRQPLCIPDTRQFDGWVVTPGTRHIRSWIGVPLIIADEVIGFLCVDKTQPGFYDEHCKNRLAALAHQVALALQQAQLFAESQRQAQRLAILNDLAAQLVGLVTVRELTDLVVGRLYEDFQYDNVVIFMIDPENPQEMYMQSMVGVYAFLTSGSELRMRVGEGIMGQVAAREKYILANDTALDPFFFQPPEFNIRAELAVPIKIDQTVLGVLNVDSHLPYTFDYADVSLLTIVADQLATAIQKARLFELTNKRAQELETLSIVSARLRAAHTVADMLPIVLENIVQAVRASVGVIYLKDETGEKVVSRAVFPEGSYLLGLAHQLGQGITGLVAQSGETYVSKNLQEDGQLHMQDGEAEYLNELYTGIALPLKTEEFIVGVIHIGFNHEHPVSDTEQQFLSSLTDIAANALYRAQVTASLEQRVEERTQALRWANIRLQELDRLKSKFISDVTHELRTPVANLNLYLDLLRVGRPEKQQHYMSVIETQTARLTQIVQTTMQAPEIEMMTPAEQFVAVNVAEVVHTAVSTFAARVQEEGLEIMVDVSPNLPLIRGDMAQLSQAVQAILANAVNYTNEGRITVALTWLSKTDMICLQITDTGMGIEEEDIPYIFDRFYRGRNVGQLTIPGVGMGLFLAKEIVEWHDGRIHIESTPGTGTTCTVYLPPARNG